MTVLELAEQAWNACRQPGDSDWEHLPMEIGFKLVHLAEKYAGGRSQAEGDYAPAGFFEKARELSGIAFNAYAKPPISQTAIAEDRRVGLANRRTAEAHLNLNHYPGSERRTGAADRRDSGLAQVFDELFTAHEDSVTVETKPKKEAKKK